MKEFKDFKRIFEKRDEEKIGNEVIPWLEELAKTLKPILPFVVEIKIGHGEKDKEGWDEETLKMIKDWCAGWVCMKDKNSRWGKGENKSVRGIVIWAYKNGIEITGWEAYSREREKENLRNRIIKNKERYLSLCKKFPSGSYAEYGGAKRKFKLPTEAEEFIKEVEKRSGKKPKWLDLTILYPWDKVSRPKFPNLLKGDIKRFLKPFWLVSYCPLEEILNAINTKPFIILSGISGTGKTQIARIISAGRVKDEGI